MFWYFLQGEKRWIARFIFRLFGREGRPFCETKMVLISGKDERIRSLSSKITYDIINK